MMWEARMTSAEGRKWKLGDAVIDPPTLHTDRLVLERLASSHSDGMFLLWAHEEVCRYSGPAQDWEGNPIQLPAESPTDSDKIIDFFNRLAAEGSGFRWALVDRRNDEFVGTVGFNRLTPRAELAFHLRPEFWGRGLAKEAALAAATWAKKAGTQIVEVFIEPENTASVGLAHRLGFAPTGHVEAGAEQFLLKL
jgi:[ribosomal protein S5]-alanine N-acetyltransferase